MRSPVVILHMENPAAAKEIITAHHPDLIVHTCDNHEGLPGMLAKSAADVVHSIRFAGTSEFPREALLNSSSLRWVSVGGSGINHLNPWDADRLVVTNSAGVAADMMAQYVLGMMLHFSLNIPEFRILQQKRKWGAGEVEPIDGKTVLVVGLGKTGQAVAQLAKTNGLKTIGVRARPEPTVDVDQVHHFSELEELWPSADFVVVCVPLIDSTRGLVAADAFSSMKETAVLIDVSRGGVVDEEALLTALDRERLRGAALDVFQIEPLPEDHALWGYDNVVITPHCSSVYRGWDLKSVEMFCENLKRYRANEPLVNVVDPKRGY